MGVEQVFEASWRQRDLRSGPLGLILDGFCDWLLERGFSAHTVRKHLGRLLHLNSWLAEQGWQWPGVLSRTEVEGFLEAYPGRCRNRNGIRLRIWSIRLRINQAGAEATAVIFCFFFILDGRHLEIGFMDFRGYDRPGRTF